MSFALFENLEFLDYLEILEEFEILEKLEKTEIMLNFDYLKDIPELATLHRYCDAAERHQIDEPEISAINARRALEWMARAIFRMKGAEIGERTSLYQIVDSDLFRDFIDDEQLMMAVHYIRKAGNAAAHDNHVTKRESFFSLLNLYNFIGGVLLKLRVLSTLKPFDKTLIPNSAFTKPTKPVEPETVEAFTETVKPEAVEAAPSEEVGQYLSWADISEAETRRLFIDLMLREAGWEVMENEGDKQPGKACVEIEVSPMPNKENRGFADYVLFGDDARPLAVIEAKRTCKDPEAGRHQAELYADALEKEYGVRPVIYFTNGFETWVIDGLGYPKRKLLAFHSKDDLARMIRRRGRNDITDMKAKAEIAGRHYQHSGIKALCEHFNKKHRRGLLVMATGTGKTRTAIALVDVLSRAGWVKNTLFLADRTSLVVQAHKNFEKLLPNSYTMTVLSDRTKEPDMNARITFSTLQTLLNHVDTDEKSYSPGHFDLIIIDEAHRSVFGKLGSTLKYFDALVVGLTATPRDQVDKSTYDLLQLEGGEPNYAYEYGEAVSDGYLVDYVGLQRGSSVVREGIKYDELSQAEKDQLEAVWEYEAALNDLEDDGLPRARDIQSREIFNYIFNKDTIDKVLQDLMDNGLKVHSGEMIGKTIIFAFNKEHAKLIVERFNHLYPDYGPDFCQRIDYSINYAQDIIEKFGVRDRMPQIAVSVDMLDTGIDVPDILNLVFFKRVRSRIKFDQMIGRGTRLSPGIFGPGKDKERFLIFDWCGNFEYFNKKLKQPKETRVMSLSEKLFGVRADIACALQSPQYQSDDFAKSFHDGLKQILLDQTARLNDSHISVRDHWEAVSRFRTPAAWEYVSAVDVLTLKNEVAPLVSAPNEDESALKFDLLVLNVQLGLVDPEFADDTYEGKITGVASALQKLGSVPEVQAKMDIINEVLTSEFWNNKSLGSLERVRVELRDLVKRIVGQGGKTFTVDIEDTVTDEGIASSVVKSVTYKKKVLDFLAENRDLPALRKIRNIEKLTEADIEELERILWQELGTKEDYRRYLQRENLTEDLSVGAFIRTLGGVDRGKALEVFTEFIQANSLTADQEEYLKSILDYVCQNGDLEKKLLMLSPFDEYDVLEIFPGKFAKVGEFVAHLHDSITAA